MKNCRTCQYHCDEWRDFLDKLDPDMDSTEDFLAVDQEGKRMARHCEDHGGE